MTTAATGRPHAGVRAERVPPQDLDAEMALLGSMMMSRDVIAEAIPVIGRAEAHWFYLPVHQKLFEILLDLYDDPAKAIDLIVVTDELRRRDLFDFVGGQEYMIQLAESFSDLANAEHYARIVRDKGMLRDLIRCASEISDQAYTGLDEARDILDLAERRIFECTEKRVSGQSVAIRDLVRRLSEQLALRDDGVCTGVPTGFTQLNEYMGGFQPGDFIVLAGRPSMGKTALGLSMAQHAAVDQRISVGFFSMEMSGAQIAQRLVCSYGHGIDLHHLRRGLLSEEDKRELLNACADFEHAPFYIDDTAGMTIMELRAKARRLKQRFDVQVVFVDYLQLMHTPQAENRQVEISTISRGMKALARELNIPVIAMAQLNRMPEGRSDKRPLMSDLRESGAIEQDADVVLLIHRDEYYKPDDDSTKGLAELIIAKQRNGPTGNITLSFNRKFTRFGNYSAEPEPYRPARPAHSDVPF